MFSELSLLRVDTVWRTPNLACYVCHGAALPTPYPPLTPRVVRMRLSLSGQGTSELSLLD